MQRDLKKEQLAKLYREFSRQKYNKYRHQFPRMRQSELVSKIIKEWEALDMKAKYDLYVTYTTEKHISDDKSQSSEKKESPGSSKSEKKKSQSKSLGKGPQYDSSSKAKTPAKKGVRVFVRSSSSKKDKDQQSISSDFARDGAKKEFEISESDSKELGVPTSRATKRKRISKESSKQPRTEYLKFFKFYYEKLSLEHKRWNANQISTIIKLLWKKKLTTDKFIAKGGLKAPRVGRKLSGRMAFRRAFGYSGLETLERWKQLPLESRKYWRSKGEGKRSGQRIAFPSSISFKKGIGRKGSESSVNTNMDKNLGYLRRTIM